MVVHILVIALLHWYNIIVAEARHDVVLGGRMNEKVTGVIVNKSYLRRLRYCYVDPVTDSRQLRALRFEETGYHASLASRLVLST
jgi:hypothetical protein